MFTTPFSAFHVCLGLHMVVMTTCIHISQEAVEALLTHHLHSEAPAGNRRMAMTFAKLRLIIFLRCIGLDWMPL